MKFQYCFVAKDPVNAATAPTKSETCNSVAFCDRKMGGNAVVIDKMYAFVAHIFSLRFLFLSTEGGSSEMFAI
jgi:hypothetical protein